MKNKNISMKELQELSAEIKAEIHNRTLKSTEWFQKHYEWRKIHLPVSTPTIEVQTENMYKPLELN